jgi:hypothetical protein
VLIRRGVVLTSPARATLITVVMGAPIFFVAALVTGQLFRFQNLDLSICRRAKRHGRATGAIATPP